MTRLVTPSERAVISLKGGELYVMSLIVDSSRAVKGFHFDRATKTVLTTCLAMCEDNYLFLGSRLGNSLLLHFTEKDIASVDISGDKDEAPPVKKKKSSDILGDIDFDVYGAGLASDEASPETVRVASYSFEVCDSLLNIGPCGNVSMGEPSFLSEEFATNVKAGKF